MKDHLKQILILLIACMIFQACEEETPQPVPVNPDDLRYEGTWQGSTSQTKLLSLQVENSESAAMIMECEIRYLDDGILNQRFLSAVDGLSEIEGGAFRFLLPDGGTMSGVFHSTDYCTGKFVIPGEANVPSSEYWFELTTDTTPESLLSPARIYFELEGVAYEFVQDDIFFIPDWENINTGTGRLVKSHFTRLDNATGNKQPVITITAGRFADLAELLLAFAPGEKKYSQHAVQGIDVSLYHPDEYFKVYSTSMYSGSQDDGFFEVNEIREIETFRPDYNLYRFSATFRCRLYRPWGPEMMLENGFFSGYINANPHYSCH